MLIRLIAIAASLLLTACPSQTVDTSCTAFAPITYSASGDTAATVLQVRQHNAAYRAICGG